MHLALWAGSAVTGQTTQCGGESRYVQKLSAFLLSPNINEG